MGEDKRGRGQECQRKYTSVLESLSALDAVDVALDGVDAGSSIKDTD